MKLFRIIIWVWDKWLLYGRYWITRCDLVTIWW